MEQANRFDLHMHSNRSDGTDDPATVAAKAKDAGLALMALTDHDTTDGVDEAAKAGRNLGVNLLPALEMDTEFPSEVHILGLNVNPADPGLTAALEVARRRRVERNRVILEKLAKAGYGIDGDIHRPMSATTRLHMADALVKRGYADSVKDAFARYLRKGCPGYYTVERFSPEQVIELIASAGGVPVWAHPFHAGDNIHKLFYRLAEAGVRGVEVYHPSASPGQSAILLSLARQRGLLVTCGSDSHGMNRRDATLGCTWRDTPELAETYRYFIETCK